MKHIALALLLWVLPASSYSAVIMNIEERGNDVWAEFSGSINTTGLFTRPTFCGGDGYVSAKANWINFQQPPQNPCEETTRIEGAFTNFSKFGVGSTLTFADSVTGDTFKLVVGPIPNVGEDVGWVGLPGDYQSGALISGSMRFENRSIFDMGLKPGEYNYLLTNGEKIDLNIGQILLPAGFPLLATAMAFFLISLRRQQANVALQ